ncbi:MAG: polyprenol phosphomannose-dependent alpha 1,6 mannosyltransferase MptB [Nocardioides sp.]
MIRRGALGSVLVLLGGLVTQMIPAANPVASAPLLQPLRESSSGRMVGLLVVVAGLTLIGSAWLRLIAATHPDTGAGLESRVRLARLAALAWSLPLLLAPPLFSRDAWSYAAQGALTRMHLSPYVWTPSILDGQIRDAVDPLWMDTPAPYGPLPLAWGAGVASITDSPWLMAVGHRTLALIGLALLAWATPRLARAAGQDAARASALVLASPLTIAHGVGGVHNDLVMAGLMAMALAVTLQRWWVLGAVLAGAAAAVKLPGGLVGIGVALASLPLAAAYVPRLRRLVSVGAIAVATLVGSGVAIGVGIGWIHALGAPASIATPLSLTTQVGRLVGQVDEVRTLGLAVVAAGLVHFAMRGRTGDPAAAVRGVAIATTALVVLSPAVREWYLLWALPFLAAVPWRRPIEQLIRDLALVLGMVAPLDSSLRGAPAEVMLVLGLVVLAVIRLRRQAGRTQPTSGTSVAA